jgi:hypothetical protein
MPCLIRTQLLLQPLFYKAQWLWITGISSFTWAALVIAILSGLDPDTDEDQDDFTAMVFEDIY